MIFGSTIVYGGTLQTDDSGFLAFDDTLICMNNASNYSFQTPTITNGLFTFGTDNDIISFYQTTINGLRFSNATGTSDSVAILDLMSDRTSKFWGDVTVEGGVSSTKFEVDTTSSDYTFKSVNRGTGTDSNAGIFQTYKGGASALHVQKILDEEPTFQQAVLKIKKEPDANINDTGALLYLENHFTSATTSDQPSIVVTNTDTDTSFLKFNSGGVGGETQEIEITYDGDIHLGSSAVSIARETNNLVLDTYTDFEVSRQGTTKFDITNSLTRSTNNFNVDKSTATFTLGANDGTTHALQFGSTAVDMTRVSNSLIIDTYDDFDLTRRGVDIITTDSNRDVNINRLSGTYTGGSAYVCVYNSGILYASETACP